MKRFWLRILIIFCVTGTGTFAGVSLGSGVNLATFGGVMTVALIAGSCAFLGSLLAGSLDD